MNAENLLVALNEENERLQARIDKLEEALIWCSGSADFGVGGVAHEGWKKLCAPLLASLTTRPEGEER